MRTHRLLLVIAALMLLPVHASAQTTIAVEPRSLTLSAHQSAEITATASSGSVQWAILSGSPPCTSQSPGYLEGRIINSGNGKMTIRVSPKIHTGNSTQAGKCQIVFASNGVSTSVDVTVLATPITFTVEPASITLRQSRVPNAEQAHGWIIVTIPVNNFPTVNTDACTTRQGRIVPARLFSNFVSQTGDDWVLRYRVLAGLPGQCDVRLSAEGITKSVRIIVEWVK
jgi:hypothetical protein